MERSFRAAAIAALLTATIGCEQTNPVTSEAPGTPAAKPAPATATIALTEDLVVTSTYVIPEGMTLDGNGFTITAVDPPGGHFVGAVVRNGGSEAHVRDLTVRAAGLANVCDAGADRLRGIMFEGASGSITHVTVADIHQGTSGCQEGNAIEIRNAPFDGAHPNTQTVEISHVVVTDYQKTGIVANGDVDVAIRHSQVGASATQASLAANSIQLGYGAMGEIRQNLIDGNQWLGTSDWAATAILLYDSQGVTVSKNNVRGNADIGIYGYYDDAVIDNNRVFDEGPDDPNSGYDIGIGGGPDIQATNNKVRGYDVAYDGVDLGSKKGRNKVIPGSQKFE